MADQFLSQDEVDALLAGVNGEPEQVEEEVKEEGVRSYDLARQERIVRGRMPTLEIINERFARNLRTGLFNFMRRNPEVAVGPVKVQKYNAFLASLVVPTNINLMQVRPLHGNGLLIFEPQLVFAIVDTLFGGSGRLHTRIEGRDFSPTEQRIIHRMVEVVCTEYAKAWEGIYPIKLEYQRSEVQPQFANIATPAEVVVTTSFTLEVADASGSVHLCIPYSTLEPLREILYSSLNADKTGGSNEWLEKMTSQISDAEVDLVAVLGGARITCAELLSLRSGDFVQLDIEPFIQAKVDETPVLECSYGLSGGRYALKVERFLHHPDEAGQRTPR